MPTPTLVGPEGRYRFSPTDVERTLHHLGLLWRQHTDGVPDSVLHAAGAPAIGAAMAASLAHHLGVDSDPDPAAPGASLHELGRRAAEESAGWDPATRGAALDATWLRLLDVAAGLAAAGAYQAQ